jgi:hypothetical protein
MNSLIAPGGSVDTSDPLELTVLPLRQSALRESAPVIEEAVDGILDLTQFVGDATVTLGNRESGVAAWPLIARGQRVWLRATGKRSDGSNWTQALLSGHAVTSAEITSGCSAPLNRATIEDLADDSEITVTGKVNFSQKPDETRAVVFPVKNYRLRKVPTAVNVDLENLPVQTFIINQPVTTPDGNLTMCQTWGGRAEIEDLKLTYEPYCLEHALILRSVRISLVPAFAFTKLRMGVAANDVGARMYCYDTEGLLVDMVALPTTHRLQGAWFDYQSQNKPVSYIEITCYILYIDNITFTR